MRSLREEALGDDQEIRRLIAISKSKRLASVFGPGLFASKGKLQKENHTLLQQLAWFLTSELNKKSDAHWHRNKGSTGRNDGIRTRDLYHPKVAHYQAVLRPGEGYYTRAEREFYFIFLLSQGKGLTSRDFREVGDSLFDVPGFQDFP